MRRPSRCMLYVYRPCITGLGRDTVDEYGVAPALLRSLFGQGEGVAEWTVEGEYLSPDQFASDGRAVVVELGMVVEGVWNDEFDHGGTADEGKEITRATRSG